MFESEGIFDHISILEDAIPELKRYGSYITVQDLIKDRGTKNMVFHEMQTAIQSCIDIANHIIGEFRFPKPATYKEAFEILTEKKIIPYELAEKLSRLAGFRNILVHLYWRVDLEKAHKILKEDITTLEEFLIIAKKVVKSNLEK